MTAEELAAREQIREVVHRYCRGADRCDGELLRSVYHPDATEDHGGFVGSAAQFCDEVIPRLRSLWAGTQHVLGQIAIELDDDVAHVETYFVGYHVRRPDEQGRVLMWELGGRYVDRFERRHGRWLIAHRLLVEDWEDMREIREEGGRPFERGRRDRRDASYRR
jgi:SnoaL-like domain